MATVVKSFLGAEGSLCSLVHLYYLICGTQHELMWKMFINFGHAVFFSFISYMKEFGPWFEWRVIIVAEAPSWFFFSPPMTYGSFQAGDWILAAAMTYAAAEVTLGPLTYCARPGIKPVPLQQPEPLQLDP